MMIFDLPLDLESEILSRVPAISLSQFRSTCKRWNALFKDPPFVKKNSAREATQVILNDLRRVRSVNVNLHGTHSIYGPFLTFTGTLKSLKDSKDVEISILSQCNGLLLCTTKDDRLVVWNPCTGQTKWIKSNKSNQNQTVYKYFLGYENKKGYKILSLSTVIGIYEFNSDSWKVLKDLDRREWCRLHNKHDGENFGRLSLPFKSHEDGNYETVALSVVREEKLAVLRFGRVSFEMKIWVTTKH
ncbi:unnamed protein product [Microthlaspi erraticum]|uniref:F-box domain-containing protein n=1 Tax=Microthlaspi erraticum TaxID=1685480 RepID=A0A6D2K8A8_9BRAS|nr:unnamed protein product [Microthlaspi erraticum]